MNAAAPEASRLSEVQRGFCEHLRLPGEHAAPADIPPRRMALYRDLLRANFTGQLASTFPVLYRTLPADDWRMLVEDFFSRHRCQSPLFHQLPRAFLEYLQQPDTALPHLPPWSAELAHYEWVELALSLSEDTIPSRCAEFEPLADIPRLSPLAWPLRYRYAVHRIGPHHRPAAGAIHDTHLLAYRDRHDAVRFMELNALSANLLQRIECGSGQNGERLLLQLAAELKQPPAPMLQFGSELLRTWWRQDVLWHPGETAL